MAGGVGSRLYPISTPEKPKQFLDLLGVGKTLIQLTYERFLAVDPDAHFWVVTSEAYQKYIKEQLPAIPDEQILLEPVARNTAPCIAYVSWKIAQRYPGARVMVAPSDAYVPDVAAFAVTAKQALAFVKEISPRASLGRDDNEVVIPSSSSVIPSEAKESGPIVTIGIRPDHPDTEYGYIDVREALGSVISSSSSVIPSSSSVIPSAAKESSSVISRSSSVIPSAAKESSSVISSEVEKSPIVKVTAFKEKPTLEVAERYLAEGGYFWNAGIFVYGVETMIAELRKFAPGIAALMDELAPSLYTRSEQSALADIFPRCEKISIDYAVMERSSLVYMAPSNWSWSDLGSFAAIEKVTGCKIVF